MNEFAGHKWFIVERERVRERPHFKAFLLFPKWGWKSAAWLSPNKWLLLPFHSTQRPNPRTTWATNVDSDWDHHSMCQTLLTTHKTHWLQLYEVKMAQKGKMWRRCPQSFLPKKGHSIWAFNAKIKPKDRENGLGHFYCSRARVERPCFVSVPLTLAAYCAALSRKVWTQKNSSNDRGLLLRNFLYHAFPPFPVLFAQWQILHTVSK